MELKFIGFNRFRWKPLAQESRSRWAKNHKEVIGEIESNIFEICLGIK
jgi:hypothetical protein